MNNEFKKSKSNNETRYVLENSATVTTGSVATAPSSLGKVQKRGNLLAQEAGKEKEAPKPRNFVAKNAKMGGAGKMKDKSKTIPRHEKHKKPVAEGFNPEYDDEAGMAHSNLLTTARAVMGLLKTIKDRDNLPEWGQEKIAKAEMMLVSVWDYLQSQKQLGNDPQQGVEEGVAGPKNCWPGHRKVGTKPGTGKNAGKRVNDCEKIKEDEVEESGLQYYTGVKKHGKEYMTKAAQLARNGASQEELGALKDKLSKAHKGKDVAEAPEDRTSYQVAKILTDRGITYNPAQENELINAIGMVLVKDLNMTPKQARHLISYDEDFVSDTLGELRSMEQSVSEVAPPGWEKTVKAMKKHDDIDNPYALAWSMKNKGYKSHKKESADPYFESLASKLDQLKKK